MYCTIINSTALVYCMLFLLTSCNSAEHRVQSKAYDLMLQTLLTDSIPSVSVDSLAQKQNRVILLDTRSQPEYEVSHIDGARFVGYESFDRTAVQDISKDTAIITYCSVGYRSEKITKRLREMGFTNVKNLYGGIFEWKNQGHTVVNDTGVTEKIHAYNKLWGQWLNINSGQKVYQ